MPFKSYVPGVITHNDIRERVGYALGYQYMFERKILLSPREMSQWDPCELQRFTIDVDRIDRLYQLESEHDVSGGSLYSMLARMEDSRVFVELSAGWDYTGFPICRGGGAIYLIANPNLFGMLMNWPHRKMERLYQCLAEDGYQLDESPLSYPSLSHAPTLKFLCHLAVYKYKDQLQHYKRVLPTILKESVTEFIYTREAINHYANF